LIAEQTPSEQYIPVCRTFRGPYRRQGPRLSALLLALVLVCVRHPEAATPEIGCYTLLEESLRSGEVPMVTIDPATDSVSLETRSGTCREAIATWIARDLPQAAVACPGSGTPMTIGKDAAPRRVVPARPRPAGPVKPFETHPLFRSPPVAPAESEPAGESVRTGDAADPSAATDAPEVEKRITLFESPDLSREFEIKLTARAVPAAEPVSGGLGIAIYGAIGSALVLVGGRRGALSVPAQATRGR